MKRLIARFFIIPIIVSALIIPTLLLSNPVTKAYADDETEPKTLYYFSDDAHCVSYRTNLLTEGIVDICYLYNWTQLEAGAGVSQYYEFMYGINNAYVIVEINKFISGNTFSDTNTVFFNLLSSLFYEMKSNGCKIMFVCGTEEALFENCTDFLDYVDIHVNTDIFSMFLINIFLRAEYDCGTAQLENCTFLLDDSFYSSSSDFNNSFIANWLIPYLKRVYNSEYQAPDFPCESLCSNKNIKIFW